MKLVSNIGKAIDKASSKSGGSDTRRINRVVKFGLFCNKVEQSFYKPRCLIIGFLT